MAAPHVAGVIALMIGENDEITPDSIEQLIEQGVLTEDLGAVGRDDNYGYGLINAYKAVSAAKGLDASTPYLLVSPNKANFGASLNQLEVEVFNGGGSNLSIVGEPTSDQSWLSVAASDDVDSQGLGTYFIQVDRSGLTDGSYSGTITFNSTVNTQTIDISMKVLSASASADAGVLYVLLLNTKTGLAEESPQAEVSVVDGVYEYELEGVAPGTYQIYAGTDNDFDDLVCDDGEACGAYPTLNQPVELSISGDQSGITFDVGYHADLSNSTLSVQNNNKAAQKKLSHKKSAASETLLLDQDRHKHGKKNLAPREN